MTKKEYKLVAKAYETLKDMIKEDNTLIKYNWHPVLQPLYRVLICNILINDCVDPVEGIDKEDVTLEGNKQP